MLDTGNDEFIPPELQENIVYVDQPDSHERDSYAIELDGGDKNDLQAGQTTCLD